MAIVSTLTATIQESEWVWHIQLRPARDRPKAVGVPPIAGSVGYFWSTECGKTPSMPIASAIGKAGQDDG